MGRRTGRWGWAAARATARAALVLGTVAMAGAGGWLLARGLTGTTAGLWPAGPAAAASTHAGPTVEQVRELAELVTVRADVADVQTTTVSGYLGAVRVALVVRGDYAVGADLSAARFEDVDPAARTATLAVPAPRASGPRVDHARTRVFAVLDEGLWRLVPGDGGRGRAVDLAYAEAQRAVAAAAADPAVADRARRQAERVLAAFFRTTGWTVRVRWEG